MQKLENKELQLSQLGGKLSAVYKRQKNSAVDWQKAESWDKAAAAYNTAETTIDGLLDKAQQKQIENKKNQACCELLRKLENKELQLSQLGGKLSAAYKQQKSSAVDWQKAHLWDQATQKYNEAEATLDELIARAQQKKEEIEANSKECARLAEQIKLQDQQFADLGATPRNTAVEALNNALKYVKAADWKNALKYYNIALQDNQTNIAEVIKARAKKVYDEIQEYKKEFTKVNLTPSDNLKKLFFEINKLHKAADHEKLIKQCKAAEKLIIEELDNYGNQQKCQNFLHEIESLETELIRNRLPLPLEVKNLKQQGVNAQSSKKYVEAMSYYRQTLKKLQNIRNTKPKQSASGQETVAELKKKIAEKAKTLPSNTAGYKYTINLANKAEDAGDITRAITLYKEALAILDKITKNNQQKSTVEPPDPPKKQQTQTVEIFIKQIANPTSLGLEMVLVHTGTFTMGSQAPGIFRSGEKGRWDDEKQHTVRISEPYFIGKFQVTQAQYKKICGNNPSYFIKDNNPVETISWYDAMNFCDKLNKLYAAQLPKNWHFTLPTEAQWEYACRAGTQSALNNNLPLTDPEGFCSNLDQVGWFDENSGERTHAVGSKKPNAWGIYDMHGNVWEWCRDTFTAYQGDAVDPDFYFLNDLGNKVIRGGSCFHIASYCRSAARHHIAPNSKGQDIGFRVILEKKR